MNIGKVKNHVEKIQSWIDGKYVHPGVFLDSLKDLLAEHKEYSQALDEISRQLERYEETLKEIVSYSKYEGNQWYENAKKAIER